ncbi:FAD/NAD(P)-binding protein [Microlunatus flavus]|uniref:FAD-NAD(P)-binding n=1 Tax=Microlunatus flavus TaxID=1036181 RepID=A0A1H9N832_9ACTN|nr:FAD/NAD(P)-binding protein [Microlunatus flavus]SER31819.1 FAD-NAD(P)-binding [Microlunatus flavus]
MPATTDGRPGLVLAVIGVGPRGAGLLERLVANAAAQDAGPVEIHLVDPYPPGGGRVWRDAQSALLRLNTTTEDLTAFVDESVVMGGPVTPGPTLAEWCETYGADLDDPELADEAGRLGPLDFPTRRLASAYLSWAVDRTLSRLPAGVTVRTHAHRAVDLLEGSGEPGAREVVVLEDGELLAVDAVVLTNSHVDVAPAPRFAALGAFADEHDLFYLPPGYAGDLDLDGVPGGQDVLVRGFGLDFVDLLVLVTEGRGGRFVPAEGGERAAAGRLRYLPSGAEPHLLVGSRRGVPYHAKPMYRLQAPKPTRTTFCTSEAVGALLARGEPIDFLADLWPLIGREVAWASYLELGLGHPGRIAVAWEEFAETFAALEWGSEAYERWIAEVVPDPADRFDPAVVDRPLRDVHVADRAELTQVLRRHVRDDVDRRADPRWSADLGAFHALLAVMPVIGAALASPLMDPRSLLGDFYGWFMGFFSFWASGPPPDRLEQLLALEEAGVVSFLGGGLEVEADRERGVFVARSTNVPGEVEAHALVEATLPAFDLARAEDPLLTALAARGDVVSQVLLAPDSEPVDTGQLRTDPAQRLVRADGSVAERRFVLGMHTAVKAAAFARPCTNAPVHRLNDHVARALLALPRSAADEARGGEPVGAGTRS